MILDEPTAALGVKQTRNVLAAVRAAAEHGAGVLLITHDVETVFAIADRIVVLRLGASSTTARPRSSTALRWRT